MKKVNIFSSIILISALLLTSTPLYAHAEIKNSGNGIVDIKNYSFENLLDTKYNKNPFVAFEVGQTYGLYVHTIEAVIQNKEYGYSWYPDGNEGFTFTSKDPSIVTVDKEKGILTGKKVGSTSVTVSYPGLKNTTIDVNITEVQTGITAQEDHKAIEAIDEMIKISYDSNSVIDYYNNLKNLQVSSIREKDHFINVPNEYKTAEMWSKLRLYLEEKKGLFFSQNRINVSKITDLSKDKLTVSLNRKLTNEDLVSYAFVRKIECTSDMKLETGLTIYKGTNSTYDESSKTIITEKANIGLGDNTITVNIRNQLTSNSNYYVCFFINDSHENISTEGLEFTAK